MRAIVTGGAGFIGSHLVDALVARGDEVHVVDNLATGRRENVPPEVELHERDVRDPLDDLFHAVEPEVCFHLAAQADVRVSVDRPVFDAEVNVLGTLRVLEGAGRNGTRVVFSSTGGAIYGECDHPAPESAERKPFSPYGVAKLAGEEYLAADRRLRRTPHVSLRYANVYGPRQDPHGEAGVVAIFFNRLVAGEPPLVYGDGSQTRDYVHVSDVVRATLAAERAEGTVYNVGTGVETSVLALLERCCIVAGVDAEPEYAPTRLGELERSVLDPSLAGRGLAWRPQHDLDSGLRSTWAWFSPRG
ncbi:MAG: NAD-dependent epimerase/dehydratase family protein [Actinomycetota bacterium]|nr:NAD-dependent epimerase/dehydratase family protein [Actinomycetota bacterium]